jgi:hypothetical protein
MSIEKEAAEAFQSLPLEDRENLCTILQAFTLGYKMACAKEEQNAGRSDRVHCTNEYKK